MSTAKRIRVKAKNTRTGEEVMLMSTTEHIEHSTKLSNALRLKDATLDKMRAEFAEYKKNKNMEKAELMGAKRRAEEKAKYFANKSSEIRRELKQREQGDAQTPWYSELKKYSKSLEVQVYNLNTDNTRLQVAIDSLTKITGQWVKEYDEQKHLTQNAEAVLSQVRAQRDWLQKRFFQKNLLFIRARNVITAFEREIKQADPFLWDRCLNNPELPELKQYLATKERYDAERKGSSSKDESGNLKQHQDRASSGQTSEAGDSHRGVVSGQVQVEAQEVRQTSMSPIFGQSYGQAVEASKKSFAGILSTPRACEVFNCEYARAAVTTLDQAIASGEAKVLNVPGNRATAMKVPAGTLDIILAIKDGSIHVAKNRFGTQD